jgi:hypothetical protein
MLKFIFTQSIGTQIISSDLRIMKYLFLIIKAQALQPDFGS